MGSKAPKGVVTHGRTPHLAQHHKTLSHLLHTPQTPGNAATGVGSVPCLVHRQDIAFVGPPPSAFAAELPLRFPVFEPLITALPTECVLRRVSFMG